MARFTLKDLLRGMTFASIGLGMLVVAHRMGRPTASNLDLLAQFLIAFGGMFLGYALAFPVKWPPYQMMLAMVGMFAAQAWFSGSSVGLFAYVGLLAMAGVVKYFVTLGAKPPGEAGADARD